MRLPCHRPRPTANGPPLGRERAREQRMTRHLRSLRRGPLIIVRSDPLAGSQRGRRVAVGVDSRSTACTCEYRSQVGRKPRSERDEAVPVLMGLGGSGVSHTRGILWRTKGTKPQRPTHRDLPRRERGKASVEQWEMSGPWRSVAGVPVVDVGSYGKQSKKIHSKGPFYHSIDIPPPLGAERKVKTVHLYMPSK